MTIWDVLQVLVRRWYVLVGAVLIGLTASYAAVNEPGAYWTHAEVTFLAPTSSINPNALRTTSSDLIITAGVVAKRVNGNKVWNQMADPAATIVGEGILDGWSVQLPNHGGQWSKVYSRQVLDVQVSGPTSEVVRERRTLLISRIEAELAGLQQDVAASDRITTAVVPDVPSIYYMHGSKVRALAMIWVLCGVGVLAAVLILEPAGGPQQLAGVIPSAEPHHGRRSSRGAARASRRGKEPPPVQRGRRSAGRAGDPAEQVAATEGTVDAEASTAGARNATGDE